MKRSKIIICLAVFILLLSGCGKDQVKLDPKNPVTITIWHYYNGPQQIAFDEMLSEFNNTQGKEQGIYVQGKGQGDVTQLEEAVRASINNQVGSEAVPNIFSSYADTAYDIDQQGYLADISQYLTAEELSEYVDSYIEEGRIGENGELRIFPTAKSSEIFMMNKTEWDLFAADTGVELELLSTKEGIAEAAKAYYEWTDAQTPDIPNDGKSFYGRDAVANLFISGSRQLGVELFEVNNREVTFNIERDVMRQLWDFYYANYIKGYFSAYGRFRSDDLKIGEIVAFTGSTTSSMYFPDAIETEDGTTYPIDYLVLTDPIFENGEKYMLQQGAGMVVAKGTPQEEYASVQFLKWFTEKDNNLDFALRASYLPVKKEAYDVNELNRIIEENGIELSAKTYDTFSIVFDNMQDYTLYTNKAFQGGSDARKILEYHLSDKAAADREAVRALLEEGMTLEEACKEFLTEEAFEVWLLDFTNELQGVLE